MANHEAPKQRRLSALECNSGKGQQGPLGSVLEGRCRMGEGRRSETRGGAGVRTESGTRTEAQGDTVKRSQGGKKIRNERVLTKWGS